MREEHTYDSLMFDMDGTLWDAVDSYCAVWNRTIADCHIAHAAVTRQQLVALMGTPLDGILDAILGHDCADKTSFMRQLQLNERAMMPTLGGKIYPGVTETIAYLSRNHKLFMVSNCGPDGLPNFLNFTGLARYFTDTAYYAENAGKDVNISRLAKRYNLKSPLYIGDTAGDCASAHAAGVPFVWARYGFGHDVPQADFVISDIRELPSILYKK